MPGILSKGQWRLHAVVGLVYALVVASALYLTARAPGADSFPRPFQAVLLGHLGVGVLVLVAGAAFVLWHLGAALATRDRAAIATGLLLTTLAALATASGLALLVMGPADRAYQARVAHSAAALLIPLFYVLHRRLGATKPGPVPYLIALASLAVFALGLVTRVRPVAAVELAPSKTDDPFIPWQRSPGAPLPGDPFFPSSVLTASGKNAPDDAIIEDNCRRCHASVFAQWESSAHHLSSFENPFYAVSVEALRKDPDNGVQRARWCAGCHDPALLLTGRWEQPIERTEAHARAGLTCLACHAIERIRDVGGNGCYVLRDDPADPYLFPDVPAIHDRLVRAYPQVHKRQMLKPELHRTAELCSACHKVSLEPAVNRYRWVRGQNEYDAWHGSGANHAAARTFYLPPEKKSCQDCHMPLEPATLGDLAAKDGFVKSHRFAAANYALPFIRKDEEQKKRVESFLQGACRVDIFALTTTDDVIAPLDTATTSAPSEVHVVVRNKGVGHAFPGGTIDSNEVWLEVEVQDASGNKVYENKEHVYKALFLDPTGHVIDRRNPQDIRATVFARTIGPSKSDLARYRVTVPAGAKITARLRYRKFDQHYSTYSGTEEIPALTIAQDSVTLGTARKPQAPLWERWNDYGVALLDQNDTRGAARAFSEVARLAPERADGPRNLARTALQDGRVEDALGFLAQAEKVAQGDAQSAFFWGEALLRNGRIDDAIAAYERVLARFPQDREARRGLAEARFKKAQTPEELAQARAAFLAVLEIDPEDRGAHYRRMLTYRGEPALEAEAAKAYERYRVDEEMKARVTDYLHAHADANREAQPLHVH
ncbi:MAG TPA: tetratricopeptide repeat protein [Planctomycetota bacterium]|nr:tetratricopeptide repeat protein [Planctomycetota bacterium]